ncbi:MAG: undecaprenyl-phosphate glucose phosphotransferase [Spirochaetes bacterium GWD1_27_9]|nr:MAG: undecaprenyl-phosphate glucose phosphotransferase [Spirochaetes bacterium GWD1_27_9]
MLKQNSNIFAAILVFFDFIFLIFSYLLAKYLTFSTGLSFWTFREIVIGSILILAFFIILEKFEFTHTYRFRPFIKIVKNTILYEIFILASFYACILFKIYEFTNQFVFYFVIFTFVIFFTEKIFIKIFLTILRRSGYNFRRYLIIGAGELGINFYRKVVSSNDLGIKIVGFLDDDKQLINSDNPEYTDVIKGLIIGTTEKIETILKSRLVDNVIIALPMRAETKIINLANLCEKFGVKAELIPDYYKVVSSKPSFRSIKDYPLIGIRNVPLENMFNRLTKRLIDIMVALAGLILCSPVFIAIMIAIKLTSKGPVFFKQKRTGFRQKDFDILKFRTMIVNEDSDKVQATKDDPRKTKIGDFLRKTNLDEIPQLINILRGEMSVVGPRPHMIAHTEEFYQKYDKYLVRHWVKPGLTGWAQVNGWRGDSDIGIRVKYDIEYIENWTLLFDIRIIFLTLFGRKVKNNAV